MDIEKDIEEVKESDSVLEEEIETIEATDKNTDESEMLDDGTLIKESKENSEKWMDKAVSRKNVVIAVALAVLLNAVLSAGMMAVFSKKYADKVYAQNEKLQSQLEQFGDRGMKGHRGGKGGMMAPEGEQNFNSAPGQGKSKSGNAQDSSDATQQSKASIGIVIKEDSGVIVSQITGENAKKAGFQEGDKITSLDGTKVTSSSDLISALSSHKAGDTVTVGIERNGQAMEVKTVLE